MSAKQQQNTSVSKTAQERATECCCCILQAKSICAEDGAEITAPDVAELEMKKTESLQHVRNTETVWIVIQEKCNLFLITGVEY